VSVPLADTLADCRAFLAGDYDEVPEDRCYMRGSMKEDTVKTGKAPQKEPE